MATKISEKRKPNKKDLESSKKKTVNRDKWYSLARKITSENLEKVKMKDSLQLFSTNDAKKIVDSANRKAMSQLGLKQSDLDKTEKERAASFKQTMFEKTKKKIDAINAGIKKQKAAKKAGK